MTCTKICNQLTFPPREQHQGPPQQHQGPPRRVHQRLPKRHPDFPQADARRSLA